MTKKPVYHDDAGAEEPVGRPQDATPPSYEDESGSEGEWNADEDTHMEDATSLSHEDIIIAVMGVTGAGKSTFISQLTKEEVTIGHSLESCTNEPGVYTYFHNGKTIRLIDTPGFDDTNRTDIDILKDIAFFLSTIYSKKFNLAGIIYLHRITDVRVTGSSYKNVQMLEKLCGDSALSHVVLATTMWNLLDRPGSDQNVAVGEQREAELMEKFWGNMVRNGSFVARHMGDAASGKAIVSHLLESGSTVVLDIQRELVDQDLKLDQTSAGKFLQKERLQAREKQERDLAAAQEALEDALKEKDKVLIEQLRQQQREIKADIERKDADQSGMQINYSTLVKEKDQQYSSLAAGIEADKKVREDEMRFIEQNLADMQDSLDRQAKDHKEELKRVMRSQNAKSAAEAKRMAAQLTEEYERRNTEMLARIAAMEEEKRERARGFRRIFTAGFWHDLIGLEEVRYDDQRYQRGGGRNNHHQRALARNEYYY